MLILNAHIRFFLEITLESTFSAVISFLNPQINSYGDYVSIAFGIMFLVINIAFAIGFPIYLYIKKDEEENGISQLYFSEIIENLNPCKLSRVFYHSSFIVRRFMFVAITFYLIDYLFLQIILFIYCNLLYLSYLLVYKPITDTLKHEIFNEICTLTLSYIMLMYTDFIQFSDVKYSSSYLFIGIYLVNIGVNLLFLLKDIVWFAYLKIKKIIILLRWKLKSRQIIQKKMQQLTPLQIHALQINNKFNANHGSNNIKSCTNQNNSNNNKKNLSVIQEGLYEDTEGAAAAGEFGSQSNRPLTQIRGGVNSHH